MKLKVRLLRIVYTMLMHLVTPVIIYRLAFRGLRNPEYFWRWRERFGWFKTPNFARRSIWIHAVSVGEFNASIPLIHALMDKFPEHPFVVTSITPTGSERIRKVLGDRVFHVYLPYDLPASVRRFLDRTKPILAVVMETEIWPNLYLSCSGLGIPILIANARLSERSLKGYGPAIALAGHCVRQAAWIAAQSQIDAERFLRLGADPKRLELVGNIKFDMEVDPALPAIGLALRQSWGEQRPVWVAASTHEAEETAILQAHAILLRRFPDALLLLVPRHPERFKQALSLCKSIGFNTVIRSEQSVPHPATQCFVVDTMGELMQFYSASDLAFVGGSLANIGGHNMLEPASLGIPVLIGPHTQNFEEIARRMIDRGAAVLVQSGSDLGMELSRLMADNPLRGRMGEAGKNVFASERGALDRLLQQSISLLQRAENTKGHQ